ncbi:hypothetical protein EDB86DRAFT_2886713 [Lactarius hatsudake]|nr:hypothetical protein EDB86DRAFT_2886713 [Lactarius hatsudake]
MPSLCPVILCIVIISLVFPPLDTCSMPPNDLPRESSPSPPFIASLIPASIASTVCQSLVSHSILLSHNPPSSRLPLATRKTPPEPAFDSASPLDLEEDSQSSVRVS